MGSWMAVASSACQAGRVRVIIGFSLGVGAGRVGGTKPSDGHCSLSGVPEYSAFIEEGNGKYRHE